MPEFHEQLKAERERLQYSQAKAADALSLKFRTYCDWEYAKSTPATVTQEGALARLRKIKTPKTPKK